MVDDKVFLKEMEVRGRTFKVYCEPRDGAFIASYDADATLRAMNLEDLYKKLMTATAKDSVKLDVAFVGTSDRWHDAWERGTVTGIHGGTGNFLVKWANGTKTQMSGTDRVFRDLTDEELKQLLGLRDAVKVAERRLNEAVKELGQCKLYELVNAEAATV